jgi:hypothetical protein
MREMRKGRALVGVVAILVLLASAAGCGQVADDSNQEAKKEAEAKAQQAKNQAKEKANAKSSR